MYLQNESKLCSQVDILQSMYPEVSYVDSYTDQDDDGSEAEADEGLQEAPGDQSHLQLPQKLVKDKRNLTL